MRALNLLAHHGVDHAKGVSSYSVCRRQVKNSAAGHRHPFPLVVIELMFDVRLKLYRLVRRQGVSESYVQPNLSCLPDPDNCSRDVYLKTAIAVTLEMT